MLDLILLFTYENIVLHILMMVTIVTLFEGQKQSWIYTSEYLSVH